MKECNKRNLHYVNKKTKEITVTYDQVIRATQYITRANDRSKTIENKKAKALLAAIHDEISKSEDGKIWIDHDFIFEITECQTNQSSNILAQLADILDAQYHRSLYFDGRTRHYGYTVEYTSSGVERLIYPEKFYELKSKKIRKRSGRIIAHTTKNNCSYHEKMGVMPQKIVASTIYRDKEINKIDNHDNQHNQFYNSKNLVTECDETNVPKNEAVEFVENSQPSVAKEECHVSSERNTETVEYVEAPIASDCVLGSMTETEEYYQNDEYIEANDFTDVPMEVLEPPKPKAESAPPEPTEVEFVESAESLRGKQHITSYHRKLKTVKTIGKDGKTYNAPYLRDFPFTDSMLQEAISESNKPHYPTGKVRAILEYLLQQKPNMQIYGGRKGFKNYTVKVINGENDYDYQKQNPQSKEDKAMSMAEISNMKRIQLEKELVKNEIKWIY